MDSLRHDHRPARSFTETSDKIMRRVIRAREPGEEVGDISTLDG